jgi:hypothetical protein
MHQPLAIAHKEGVRFGDTQIIHPLRLLHLQHALHNTGGTIRTPDVHPDLEVLSRHPAAFVRVEGMLRCRFQLLTSNRQVRDDLILVRDQAGDRVAARRVECLVVGDTVLTDHKYLLLLTFFNEEMYSSYKFI